MLLTGSAEREPAGVLRIIDLGEAWTDFTGLPFLYAVWMFRPGAGDAEAVRLLQEAKEEGVSRIEEIAARAARELPYMDEDRARDYLTKCIRYDVGAEEEEGLRRYYEYLAASGLAPAGWEAEPLAAEV